MVPPSQEYSTPMKFGDLEFRFRWVPTLMLALPVPLFVALGFWQLDRADQKHERASTLNERSAMAPFVLGSTVAEPEPLRFRKLQATGTFEAEGQILIENRRRANRIGFQVITPLRIQGSDTRVLVNRGWIPAEPDGTPTSAPVPETASTVTGEAHIPSPPALVLHEGTDAAKDWGERWPYLTVGLYAEVVDYPVQPVVILLDADYAGGFLRNWPREMPEEGMHIGYAIQWFAFALIALVLWLRLSLERRPDSRVAA